MGMKRGDAHSEMATNHRHEGYTLVIFINPTSGRNCQKSGFLSIYGGA